MRLIDADELMDRLHERLLAHNIKCDSDRCARAVIISCMEAADRSLTISYHTNQPLTLKELQKMDGKPVWIAKNGEDIGFALIYAPCSIVYLATAAGRHWDVEDLIEEGVQFYRCKPEELESQ